MRGSISIPTLLRRFWRRTVDTQACATRRLPDRLPWIRGLLVAAVACGLLAGCEGGGSGGGGDEAGGDVVGTWSLTHAGSTWFITFNPDMTWRISNNADGSGQRVYGNYTVDGSTVRGPMVNPGVGTGEIVATVDGNAITLDFIEHWHTPYKVVPYTGSRL